MSSIAYVCDESMVEYHRLSQHKEILFWRIATKRKFSDFHVGDLLFFYAKTPLSSQKKFIGYGHYSELKKMSLNQMWNQYGELTGYYSQDSLKQAIQRASRNHIPTKMNCLVLKNVVFFARPIDKNEINLKLSKSLESFAYIDHQQPSATSDLLKIAEQEGINIWSNSIDKQTNEVFVKDAIEQRFLSLTRRYPNELSKRIQREQVSHLNKIDNWKNCRDFQYRFEDSNQLRISSGLFKLGLSKQKETQLFVGRWMCIIQELKERYPHLNVQFNVVGHEQELEEIVKKVFK